MISLPMKLSLIKIILTWWLSLLCTKQLVAQWIPFGLPNPGNVSSVVWHDSVLYAVYSFREVPSGIYTGRLVRLDSMGWQQILLPEARQPSKVISADNQLLLLCRGFSSGDSVFVMYMNEYGRFEEIGLGFDHSNEARLHDLAVFKNELYAAGRFSDDSMMNTYGLAVWRNKQWQVIPHRFGFEFANGEFAEVFALHATDSLLYLGGNFQQIDTLSASFIAAWNGSEFLPIGQGFNKPVFALCAFRGTMYAGGAFTKSGKKRIDLLARWQNKGWEKAEITFIDTDKRLRFFIRTLSRYNDTLIIGGLFNEASLYRLIYPVTNVIGFDGRQLFSLADGPNGTVTCALKYEGQLLVGGAFNYISRDPAEGKMGLYLFTGSTTGEASFIHFEVYPDPATTYVGITYPPNQNIRFIFLLDGLGRVIGGYHPWQRMFYVGNLSPGIYAFQLVDFNHVAHEKSFMVR